MSGAEWGLVPRPWRMNAWRAAAMLAAMATAGAVAQEVAPTSAALSLPPKDMCAVPRSLLPSSTSLRHIHAAWVKGEPVVVVAIGSGSSVSSGGGESRAFPNYLQTALAARFPGRDIKIVHRGHPGESASQLLARFPTEVLAEKPSLVIWQTGTVDAVRSLDVDTFATTVNAGIAFLEGGNSDVILVNPQYATRMELIIHYDPYLAAMEQAAGQSDAILFDRYRIMRYWVAKGRLDLSSGSRDDRRKKAEQTQACVGVLLADVVGRALQ